MNEENNKVEISLEEISTLYSKGFKLVDPTFKMENLKAPAGISGIVKKNTSEKDSWEIYLLIQKDKLNENLTPEKLNELIDLIGYTQQAEGALYSRTTNTYDLLMQINLLNTKFEIFSKTNKHTR